jgi:lysophospholipase L1-like esterase
MIEFQRSQLVPGVSADYRTLPPAILDRMQEGRKRAEAWRANDWPWVCRYAPANAALTASGEPVRTVFLGDSITEAWRLGDPGLFGHGVVDRGISGQTTQQILLRFYPDVVALHPKVVHIMAGTNDVAGNTGPISDDEIVDNIRAMIDIAQANRIRVVLASILPASAFPWKAGVAPAARIAGLNARLRRLAGQRRVTFVDYHGRMADKAGGLPRSLANDGVHPNLDGYKAMRPLADRAIAQALR